MLLPNLSRRSVLSATPLAIFAPHAAAVEHPAPVRPLSVGDALPQLQKIIEEAMQRTGVPGIAVAVVHRGRVLYLEGYGVRETGKPALIDPDTVFQLASLSKPIASTVVAGLVGDHIVAWDDPIVRHDPGFEMYDAWVTRQVTLRDMFAHRSGLPEHAGDLLEDIGYDRSQILYRLRYQKPASSFRSTYAYTNFGLTAAALAAADASGIAWEDLCAERLYRPLGMRHTSSRFADLAAAANRAHGHVKVDGKWVAKYTRDPDAQSPAGGVSSSARDMAMWMRLQLEGGKFESRQVVAAAPLAETHRPQIVSTPPKDPAVDFAGFCGLGWNIGYSREGGVQWSHSGAFDLGAATTVYLLPGQRLGIVVLTNAQPIGVPEAIARSFLDLVLVGKIEKDWLALYGEFMKAAMAPTYGAAIANPPPQPAPALPAAAYTGRYLNDLYGDIEIDGGDSGLMLRLGPQQTAFPLRHFDRDVFTYQPAGENAYGASAVTFTVAAGQQAKAVTIENLDIDGQGRFVRAVAAK